MKFSILSTFFALGFASNLVSAASIPQIFGQSALEARAYGADTEATRTPMAFPPTAMSPFGPAQFKRDPALGLTNGELLRRGLQPARPRKLMDKKNLGIRQAANTPPQAFPSPATTFPSRLYTSGGCRTGVTTDTNTRLYVLTYTDLQDLANQCAAQQDADRLRNPSNVNRSFALYTAGGGLSANCATGVLDSTAAVTCTATSVGIYVPSN